MMQLATVYNRNYDIKSTFTFTNVVSNPNHFKMNNEKFSVAVKLLTKDIELQADIRRYFRVFV